VAVSAVVLPSCTFVVVGCTVTLATCRGATVTVLVPTFPSLVAEMVTEPGATPVTTPLADTTATWVSLDVQAIARFVTVPAVSRTVADSGTASPTVTLALDGCTVTDPTGTWVTVTAALPLTPSLVAEIVTMPARTPVTTPAAETVAIVASLERHATVRSVTTAPLVSRTVATSRVVSPAVIVVAEGATETLPTGIGTTVTAADPVLPSLVALTVAVPGATAVTTPFVATVATAGLFDAHVTARSVTTTLFASRTTTTKALSWVRTSVSVDGDSTTLPTGTGTTVTVALPE